MAQSLERLIAGALEEAQQCEYTGYSDRPEQNDLWLANLPDADAIALKFARIIPNKVGEKHMYILVPGTEFTWDARVWLMGRRLILYPNGDVLCTRLAMVPHLGQLTSANLREFKIDDYVIDL